MATTRTIYVKRAGQSHQLILRDSEGHVPGNDRLTTNVDVNDTVVWELDTDSGLTSLQGVVKVDSSDPSYDSRAVTLLQNDLTPNGGKYQATVVSVSPGKDKFENYKIGFTVPNDTITYWDDPTLKMNT
jgi:hypothetical protein